MASIIFDIHTHTKYSHGTSTVDQNARAALEQGILLGISEHGPGHLIYGVRSAAMGRMKEEIDAFNCRLGRRLVIQGVEGNLMQGCKTDYSLLKELPEVLLMGFHKGASMLWGASLYGQYFFNRRALANRLTRQLIQTVERQPVDVITHPGEYLPIEIDALSRAAARLGVVLELNAHHHMDVQQARIALDNGAYFLLSSDAHSAARVGDVAAALEIAQNAQIPPERIVNSGRYSFDAGLRIDKLGAWIRENNIPLPAGQ